MKQRILTLLTGVFLGAALFGGGAQAAELFYKAFPSTNTVYLDGQRVELEAFAIGGHNYVKLRDVGELLGFNVYWDGAVQIESDQPYTGKAPVQSAEPAAEEPVIEPVADVPDREAYMAIRDALVHSDEVLAGNYTPMTVSTGDERYRLMNRVVAKLGNYPTYTVACPAVGELAVNVKYSDAYSAAAEHTQPFLNSIVSLSDREKVREIVFYVGEHISYSVAHASPAKTLVSDVETPGSCMAYAHATLFLCQRAGVPCVLVSSDTHQWNTVYVDGAWQAIDASVSDISGRQSAVFFTSEDLQGRDFIDNSPDITRFAQELLAPGSTK